MCFYDLTCVPRASTTWHGVQGTGYGVCYKVFGKEDRYSNTGEGVNGWTRVQELHCVPPSHRR